jgi:twinkle protein
MLNQKNQDLLEARGLDIELAERLGISNSSRPGFDIEIPYFRDGSLVNRKYRTISGVKKFSQDEGAPCIFWNRDVLLDESLRGQPIIITEGELDAIACIQAGLPRVISVPNGAPANPIGEVESGKYNYLDDVPPAFWDHPEEPVILASDGDEAGTALRVDLEIRIGRHRCKWLRYPKGTKDLADALAGWGIRGVTETVNRAQWCRVPGVYRMDELPPLNEPPALVSGVAGMDNHYRVRVGDLTVVTGIPNYGKSSFVLDLACRMAIRHGWNTVLASFEAKPQTSIRRTLRTFYNGRRVVEQSPEELNKADGWISKHFHFVSPNNDDEVTLTWLLERILVPTIRSAAKLVIIDPWNEMDHDRPSDRTMTEYVGMALRKLRRFAQNYNVHVVIVAHPRIIRREGDKLPVPTMYDISDSAFWYNRCDVGVIIHRDGDKTLIKIPKTRDHEEIGEPGDAIVRYVRERATYEAM